MHMDNYIESIDDLRFVHLDELQIGPKIKDMVTCLSSSPKLSKRKYKSNSFKLFCLCLGQVVPKLPDVSLDSPHRSGTEVDLADVIEPLQSYLLTNNGEQNIFLSLESVSSCVEMLAEFGDKSLQPSYDPCSTVDFHGRAKIHADLTKTFKDVRVAGTVEPDADVTLSSGSSEKLLPQKKHPAQRPRIDLSNNSKAIAARACVWKLRSSRTGTSGDAC